MSTNAPVKRFDIAEEAKVIPKWSVALGIFLFAVMQFFWHAIIPHRHPANDLPPVALRIFLSLFFGALLFVWSLLIGYVNRDSKRRGMNRTLWTIIAIFIPNGVGFILYFLLRDPLQIVCPRCAAIADPGFTFCPKCRFELRPTCPKCGHGVRLGDLFCSACGSEVAKPVS